MLNAPQLSHSRVAQLRDLQKRLAEIESGSGVGPGGLTVDADSSVWQSGGGAVDDVLAAGQVAVKAGGGAGDESVGDGVVRPVGEAESLARAIVLRQLAAAPKSRAQLAGAMAKHEVPAVVAEAVLDRFEAVGLVDDVALAEMLVRTRHSERGLTGPALAAELRRRGLSDEVAETAMSQITPDDQAARARALARRKLAATTNLGREVRRRRTYAHLARKGYSPSVACRALDEALAEALAEEPTLSGPSPTPPE